MAETCVKKVNDNLYEVTKGAGIGANSGLEVKKSPERLKAEEALKNAQTALENAKDATDDDKTPLKDEVAKAEEYLKRLVALEDAKKALDNDPNDKDLQKNFYNAEQNFQILSTHPVGDGIYDKKNGGKSSNKNSKNSKGGALSFSELGSSPSATVPIKTHGGKSRKCKKGGKTRKNKKSTKKCSKKRCAKKCSKKRCAKKSSKK